MSRSSSWANRTNHRCWRKSLADRLILGSGDIDVCVVRPLASAETVRLKAVNHEQVASALIGEYSTAFAITFVIVSVCWALQPLTGYMFVALVFLLGGGSVGAAA